MIEETKTRIIVCKTEEISDLIQNLEYINFTEF